MKNKTATTLSVCLLVALMAWSLSLHAAGVTVKHAPSTVTSLQTGWDWAVKSAYAEKGKNGFYIGYSISRLMKENSFMGSWYSDSSDERSLSEIIYNKTLPGPGGHYRTDTIGEYARVVLKGSKKNKEIYKKVMKEVAFIFQFNPGSSTIEEITVSNISMPSRMQDASLFWLGKKKNAESFGFLKSYYKKLPSSLSASQQEEIKGRLITAVAQHDDTPGVFPFLAGIIKSNENHEVREKACFWIGTQKTPEAVKLLLTTAKNDRSIEVRKKAVFGIYLCSIKEADDALIYIAKNGKEREIRKKAIFWLGQKAVKHSARILTGLVNDGKDRSIQKAAIFALSQLKNEQGVSSLIKIAKTHKDLRVKKKAIFWLSQSDDPRALDAIIELIEN